MKKKIFAVLAAVLILFASILPASALDFLPFYAYGDPANNGHWAPLTQYIWGDFAMDPDYYAFCFEEYAVESFYKIWRDERDEEGSGNVWYYVDFWFDAGFYSDGVFYNKIQIILHALDQEPRGTLNDINFLGPGYQKNVYHVNYGTVTYTPHRLNFGSESDNNIIMLPDMTQSERFDIMALWFSGPVINGYITGFVGVFIPIVYYTGSGGSGGSAGSDHPSGGSGGDSAAVGFTKFFGLILNFFKDILQVNFFGGFFSIGDLVGIVLAFGILFLAIRWFAGG